jgi:hypothetical protein
MFRTVVNGAGFLMNMTRHAILTVTSFVICLQTMPGIAAPPPPPGQEGGEATEETAPPFEPFRVRFRLRDGIQVTGEITGWDREGIDGSFARREWTEIDYEDVWILYRRVMDQESVIEWVDLGRVLLFIALDEPKAEKWAERAFRRAERAGEDDPELDERYAPDLIAETRAELEDERRHRKKVADAARAERLRVDYPEGRSWGNSIWPPLTASQQEDATATMRDDAERILEKAGLLIAPVETDYFLFYSDMPRQETARWANELDLMYKKLAERFRLPEGENIFWGKAVIFVFTERDRFRMVEAESFGQLVTDWVEGLCHPIGPKVFVSFYRPPQDAKFATILVHETAHGFMHRYITPRRLPAWANEGIADYLASVLFRNSPVDFSRRRRGLEFIRSGGDVDAILDWRYADGSWPGPETVGYDVGYLLIELMIRDRPAPFEAWVRAIKRGKPWEQALEEDFGVTRAQLVETFVRYYRVND